MGYEHHSDLTAQRCTGPVAFAAGMVALAVGIGFGVAWVGFTLYRAFQ